jgi:hypothetical protein
MMHDDLNYPMETGTFTIQNVDAVTGVVHEFGEDLYLEPEQRDLGWPALHLYSFRHANDWDPAKAKEWVADWLRWSLPPGCDCVAHWQRTLETFPLSDAVLGSPDSFFDWSVKCHNHVNARLNTVDIKSIGSSHPQVPLARAREIWSRIAAAGQVAWFRPVNDTIQGGRRLVITVATGKAREWLRYTEGPMRAYAEACGADFVALKNTTQGWWGLEKFRVHEFAKAYDQTLYLDADVILTQSAKNLFELSPADVSIYDETGDIQSPGWLSNAWHKVTKCLGSPAYNEIQPDYGPGAYKRRGRSYNSGVVLCAKRGSSVWTPPTLPIPTELHVAEQIVVGWNLMRFNPSIHPLSVTHNLQSWNPLFVIRLLSAEIVHLSGIDKKTEAIKTTIELLKSIGNPVLQGCE